MMLFKERAVKKVFISFIFVFCESCNFLHGDWIKCRTVVVVVHQFFLSFFTFLFFCFAQKSSLLLLPFPLLFANIYEYIVACSSLILPYFPIKKFMLFCGIYFFLIRLPSSSLRFVCFVVVWRCNVHGFAVFFPVYQFISIYFFFIRFSFLAFETNALSYVMPEFLICYMKKKPATDE